MSEEPEEIEEEPEKDPVLYEILSCGHQNNLLTAPQNEPGICPKRCKNVKVKRRVRVKKRTKDD